MAKCVVDLLDTSGTIIGDGPLIDVERATSTETLDEIGSFSIDVPATNKRVVDLLDTAAGVSIRADDGYTFRGLIRSRSTRVSGDRAIVNIAGVDLLAELGAVTCGWEAVYNTFVSGSTYGDDINSVVIPHLLANTGWSAGSVDASLGLFVGPLSGLSRLAGLQVVRQRVNCHIRQGSTARTLDFGAFGSSSGYAFRNFAHQLAAQDGNTNVYNILALDVTIDREDVTNLIVPLGAGDDNSFPNGFGKVRLQDLASYYPTINDVRVMPGLRGVETTTIAGSSGTTIKVASTTGMIVGTKIFIGDKTNHENGTVYLSVTVKTIVSIVDGTTLTVSFPPISDPPAGVAVITNPQLYIYDATAYAANPRAATIVFPEIDIPYRNSTGNLVQFISAAKSLYDRAQTYLALHKEPQTIYRMTPIIAPAALRVGQTVQLDYHGRATRDGAAVEWIDISAALYVLSITRSYAADGRMTATIETSNILRAVKGDGALLTGLSAGQGLINLRV